MPGIAAARVKLRASATIRRAHAVQPLAAIQSEYSLWPRDPEAGVLPVCAELGIGFVPWSPLGAGYLTGTIGVATALAEVDFRACSPRLTAEARAANQTLIEALRPIATPREATLAQVALVQRPYVVPITGTTKLNRLAENLGASAVTFTQPELANIGAALEQLSAMGDRYSQASATMAGVEAPEPASSG